MLRQVLDIIDVIDDGLVNGDKVVQLFKDFPYTEAACERVYGEQGYTDFVKIMIKGKNGKSSNGDRPTLSVIGRLGGIGARPKYVGMVSDADGCVTALAVALKLSEMSVRNDRLEGDVIVTTHICPDAPTVPHFPVDFMGSPVDMDQMNQYEVAKDADAVITIDTTKGNNFITNKGFSISPTVKEGYILKVCQDLVNIMQVTSGQRANVFPLCQLDITPYSNDMYHINSILQPATSTDAPVVGVAITTETAVPGCATSASHEVDIAEAARFTIEVAKQFTEERISFYDRDEFEQLVDLYGKMNIFQTNPKN